MSWTPLFSDIVDSSIWGESKETRLVWVTLLAKKDKDGYVGMSVPGLARAAVVTLAEAQAALKVLCGPDPLSRSKEHEGRRIQEVEGGWVVLNHFKYRDRLSTDAVRKAKQAAWQKEYRKRKRSGIRQAACFGAQQAIREGLNGGTES